MLFDILYRAGGKWCQVLSDFKENGLEAFCMITER